MLVQTSSFKAHSPTYTQRPQVSTEVSSPTDTYTPSSRLSIHEDVAVYGCAALGTFSGAASGSFQGAPGILGGAVALGLMGAAVGSYFSERGKETAQRPGGWELAGGIIGAVGGGVLTATVGNSTLGLAAALVGMIGGAVTGLTVSNVVNGRV